jgi:hypothetical protein
MPGVESSNNMSSEEQAQQAAQAAVQAQAQAAAQANQQSATRTRGPAIEYRLEASSDDARRAYTYTEAMQYMHRYRSLVHQQSATPESWFSLYEIAKARPAAPNFQVDVSRTSLGDSEETVQVLEDMWKVCGYEVRRRPGFEDAVALNPARTAQDVGVMISLLIAENEWEKSVAAYRNGNESQGKAKYLVMADPVHTPQTKSAPRQMRQQLEAAVESDYEHAWPAEPKVKKKLEFADSDSEDDGRPMKTKSGNPVVNTLMGLMKTGHLTMEELAKVATTLASSSQDVVMDGPSTRAKQSVPVSKASTKSRTDIDWEHEVDMDACDGTTWNNP